MAFPTSLTSAVDGVTDVLAAHINALETKVGIDASAVTTSHDYKLNEITGSDEAVGKSATQTLTNKTLTSPVINVGSDATGDLYYRSAGVYTRLGIGSTGQLLTVASGLPAWATAGLAADGWASAGETWTYASATSITVPSDATTKYNKGDKIRIKQGAGYLYFYVVTVTATTLTVTGGNDYTVANAAITDNYYSKVENPLDFPDWFGYDPTWTGFSAAPTADQRFKIQGNSCTLILQATGTSNSATFDFTLPVTAAATIGGSNENYAIKIVDNGAHPTAMGLLGIQTSSATAKVGLTLATAAANAYAGFTTSGTKGIQGTVSYKI